MKLKFRKLVDSRFTVTRKHATNMIYVSNGHKSGKFAGGRVKFFKMDTNTVLNAAI